MSRYWQLISSGTRSIDAARQAFGELDRLEKELDAYQSKRRMLGYVLEPEKLPIGPVRVRKLPEGEAEMMPIRIRSQRGVTPELAAELVVDARKVAAEYPDDPGVLTALAEAEYDSGHDDGAIKAADRAIAIDPSRKNAYVQKGYALFRKAEQAEDVDAAYRRAMVPFAKLNKLENDHPCLLSTITEAILNEVKSHRITRVTQ